MMRTRTPERTRRRASTRPVGPAPQTRTSTPWDLLILKTDSDRSSARPLGRGPPQSGRRMRLVETAGQARGHSGIPGRDVARLARIREEVVDLQLPGEHGLAHALPAPHPRRLLAALLVELPVERVV